MHACELCNILLLLEFGFSQPDFVGVESGQTYQVQAGYLWGRPQIASNFIMELVLGSASRLLKQVPLTSYSYIKGKRFFVPVMNLCQLPFR